MPSSCSRLASPLLSCPGCGCGCERDPSAIDRRVEGGRARSNLNKKKLPNQAKRPPHSHKDQFPSRRVNPIRPSVYSLLYCIVLYPVLVFSWQLPYLTLELLATIAARGLDWIGSPLLLLLLILVQSREGGRQAGRLGLGLGSARTEIAQIRSHHHRLAPRMRCSTAASPLPPPRRRPPSSRPRAGPRRASRSRASSSPSSSSPPSSTTRTWSRPPPVPAQSQQQEPLLRSASPGGRGHPTCGCCRRQRTRMGRRTPFRSSSRSRSRSRRIEIARKPTRSRRR